MDHPQSCIHTMQNRAQSIESADSTVVRRQCWITGMVLGTATESLSDESAPDDGGVDRKMNEKILQPGIAFYFKGKPG